MHKTQKLFIVWQQLVTFAVNITIGIFVIITGGAVEISMTQKSKVVQCLATFVTF
jgi:hypothetical protein